ncbi:hypothetical protein FRB98_007756 [Tulasnella sp. 332]|nr:hypothetical protein FRB98_007756 [Tulasnella sp. 332]
MSQPTTIVKSPQLKSLVLSNIDFQEDPSGTEKLLTRITFGGCKWVKFSVKTRSLRDVWDDSALDFDHSSTKFIESIKADINIGEYTHIKFTCNPDQMVLGASGDGLGNGLELVVQTRVATAAERERPMMAAKIVRSTCMKVNVVLHVEIKHFPVDCLEEFLMTEPVIVDGIDRIVVLQRLARKSAGGDRPFPNLKAILLDKMYPREYLRESVEARWIKFKGAAVGGSRQDGFAMVALPSGLVEYWCIAQR